MSRERVMAVVIKNMKLNIDGLDDIDIDPRKSMLEYGASSLDLVEIVSSSMRDLQIKVSRTELAELESIDGLVDLFSRHVASGREDAPQNGDARPAVNAWTEGEV
jgi:acyl carrier protein